MCCLVAGLSVVALGLPRAEAGHAPQSARVHLSNEPAVIHEQRL